MKTKTIYLIVMISLFVFCSEKPLIIKFQATEKGAIPFKKFEKIFVSGFTLDSPVTDPDPQGELIDFFTNDFQQAIKRKVEYLPLETGSSEPITILKEKLKNIPNSLLITGEFSIDIKTRSIIKEVKNKNGKKQKAFVKIQLWNMEMKVIFIETDTFTTLRENTFIEKLKDADPRKTTFNFKSLFDGITERLIQKSLKQVKIQERYLLKNRE
jgi:hypothetical protein